ncbi:MAG: zinc-dependent metalloprotease, partial [Candidatus Nanopelagicales bacterium]
LCLGGSTSMSGDIPFGFGQPRDPDDNNANNPFGAGGGDFDMASLGAALQQLGSMLQSGGRASDGPVNWDLATDTARQAISAAGDPAVGEAAGRAAEDAVGLADVWLDPATTFPSTGAAPKVWSRSEWLAATTPAWKSIVAPIAEQLQSTMSTMMPGTEAGGMGLGDAAGLPEGLPPELAAMAAPLMGMAKALGAAVFGSQVGQGLAALAGEVVSSSDVGIPLTTDGRAALLPENIKAFSEGLDLSDADVMVFIALRESAHQRLFSHVPWLRSRIEAALTAYASGVRVDSDRIESALQGVDVQNPEALQEALSSGVFEQEDTAEQKAALARLETLLALIEGWVDDVVDAAVADRLPSHGRLRETLRRRRATGGPAEKTFATLVGLELRPRRLREAAALWSQLREEGGVEARDALWGHPDLLPTAEDLDDVPGFIERSATEAIDTSGLDASDGNDHEDGDESRDR